MSSWQEYKKKRKPGEEAISTSVNSSEMSSWEKYKQGKSKTTSITEKDISEMSSWEKYKLEKENKKAEASKKEEKDTWFKKSELYDDDKGNVLTDTIGTVGATVGDAGTNIVKGVVKIGEGLGDALSYGLADIYDWRGNDARAAEIRTKTQRNLTDSMFAPATDYLDKYSVLGEKSDSIAEGLGYVAGMTAVGYFTGGVGVTATTFTNGMANGMTEALNSGASVDEARLYGAISGAGEAVSELMFGGLGKASGALGLSKGIGEFDDMIIGGLTKNIKNKMVKKVMQFGLKASGEGLEEVVSGLISAAGKKATYMSERELKEIVKDEKLAEQFWMGTLTSAIAQGPSMGKSIRNKTDYITGRTDNEQKVYDSEIKSRTESKVRQAAIEQAYNEQIKTYENLGIKIKDRAKSVIMQKVENAYDNGTLKSSELSKKELGEIEEQVQKDLEQGNISIENIRGILGENVDLKKDNLLMRSVYENEQRYNSYKVETTDNEKVNVLMQSAADAGMNNTSKTRKKVELIAKLTKDTDRQYKFVSPEQLKQMGYREDANGLIDKSTGEILINAKSGKGIQSIVGHETTHIFDTKIKQGKGKHAIAEYTKEYQALQDAAIEYAKTIGVYDAKVGKITSAYGNLLTNESQIKEELTADLVGDFLFNEESFIENLAAKNRNIFQKIYDYIKHTYKMMKGTEEEKAFEELKSKFEKVYKTVGKTSNQVTKEGAKYSLSDSSTNIETISDIKEKYKDKTKYLILSEHEKTNTISINNMVVKEELRNQGIGQSILNDVIEYANKNNKVITLTPTTEFNTQNRLKKWYKANGFVENKGRNTDFLISDTMYKLPDTKVQYSLSDNTGRTLTEYTVEKTKNSKVRDEKGNLMLMYHGSPDGTYEQLKAGSYFTPNKEYAERYKQTSASSLGTRGKTENNPRVYEAYLNIEKPFDLSNEEARRIYIEEYIKGGNAIGINPYLSDAEYDKIDNIDWTEVEDLKDFLIENEYDFDGIIANEGGDLDVDGNVSYRGNSYIPFSEEQIIKANDNNTKYSLSKDGKMIDNSTNEVVKLEASDTGTHGTLMAIHNLNESKLKGILELGGFPVPSIAITKVNNTGSNQFGNITVVFDKSTINPEDKRNEVYDRDVWTPTFPKVEYDIDTKVLSKLRKIVGGYGNEYLSRANSTLNNLDYSLNNLGLERVLEDIKKDENFKYVYAKTLDNSINPVFTETVENIHSDYSNETLKEFIDEYGEIPEWSDISSEERNKLINKFKDKVIPELEKRIEEKKKKLFEENPNPPLFKIRILETAVEKAEYHLDALGYQDSLIEAMNKIAKGENTVTRLDREATKNLIDSKINQLDYEKWVDENFGSIVASKGIYNGKDYMTPSGNRRSFKQLHENYDLQSIVKHMTKQKTVAGEEGFGAGSGYGTIQAQMSTQFKSIDEIRQYADKRIVPNEEEHELTKTYEEAIWQDMSDLAKYYKYRNSQYTNATDITGYALNDFAGYKTQNIANLKKALDSNNIISENVPNELLHKIVNDINALKEIPTNYFEAKPQRAVGLDEVQAVVIPNNTDAQLKQQLVDRGLNVIEYDSSIEGDKQSKINELDEYKFSLTNDTGITGDDIAVRDMLKEEGATIDEEVGKTPGAETLTVEDVLNQTPEEKEQGMKEKAKKYLSRSKTRFIEKIVNDFGTSKIANTKTLNSVVDRIREDIQNNGALTKEKADSYFNELYNNLVTIDTLYYDTYKDVKDDIRTTKLYISDTIKNDITDYNDFRRRNMGTLVMTNDSNNLSVDSYYQEMSELYPELFPADIINPTDQLERIAEVAKDISKVERNVAAYNDIYEGPDYRDWARAEFDRDVNSFMNDIKLAERYNSATDETLKIGMNKEIVKNAYKQIPAAKKAYEKALAKELLTKEDKVQVDRLLNNEIDISQIPEGLNRKGIVAVATAKQEYDILQKAIKEYQDDIRHKRIELAEEDIGNIDSWKDKKTGFRYSRETAIRNIYDVAPKEVADKIANKYFRSYIEVNEKKVVDTITEYNDRIRALDIGTKNKYKITVGEETKKVSESALIQLLGEKKISVEAIKDSGANVTKIERAVNTFRGIYNELIEQINESMLDNGYAPMEYRKDYFPHFTEETTDTLLGKAAKLLGIDITNREELPTDIAGQTYKFKPGRTWFGNMLQRTTDVTDYDALKGFDKYVRGATDLIYHTGDIQNLRALSTAIRGSYNDAEIKNRVEEIKESTMSDLDKSIAIQDIYEKAKDKSHLSKFVEWLDNYTNLLAGKKAINDRGLEKELNRQMYKTMQDVESRIAANTIGGNIGVSLTNFAAISQAWGEVKTTNLINGIWNTMKASLRNDSSFASESQFITRRRGADTLVETTIDKVTKPINTVLEFADKFSSEVIVRARYNQNLQEGMSPELALEEADRFAAGLMADRGRGALPTQFSNKNPISKLINMFQVEVNNQWSYYIKDLPKNIQEKANGNKAKIVADTAMAYTKIMVGAYLTNELLGTIRGNSTRVLPDAIYIISELIKGLTDDDDENDDDAVIQTLTEIAGNVPFVSLPATLFADSFGLDVGDIGRISVSGAIPNVADITSDVINMINGEKTVGEGLKSIGGELADTVGASLVLPYGGSQIKKTIKGLSLYANDLPGSYTDSGDLRYTVEEDVGSKVQAAIFGAYANPYAQDYIDSGFKSIKKDNIDEMVGLDMNSSEYRQFKSNLSKVSDTSDKHGYKQYVDENDNTYWYDSETETMYDDSYKKTKLTADDLVKVSKKEEALNFINSSDLTDSQKNLVANNLNKNSKKKIDMKEYGKYDSYDEYQYARDYPEKYSVVSQIAPYDEYEKYRKTISDIKEAYSTENGYESKERKTAVQNYIESLELNVEQKMMLEKMAGGYSIKNYKNYIYNYLETLGLTESEKYTIWEELFN